MAELVIDASVYTEYLLRADRVAAVEPFFDAGLDVTYVVPDSFQFEMASALRKHHRSHLTDFSVDDLARLEADLRHLAPITFVRLTELIDDVLACPKTYPTYDAAYVVLARGRDIPLCSLDVEQSRCATEEQVELLTPGTPDAETWLRGHGWRPA